MTGTSAPSTLLPDGSFLIDFLMQLLNSVKALEERVKESPGNTKGGGGNTKGGSQNKFASTSFFARSVPKSFFGE